jgi:hypothetical protein
MLSSADSDHRYLCARFEEIECRPITASNIVCARNFWQKDLLCT